MKYIALSDLHLGQTGEDRLGEFSLLSCGAKNSRAELKIEQLGDTIRDFAGSSPVSMILVGDVLDLSLSYIRNAMKDFQDLLARLPAIHELVYVVGNHDHHIWTMHCEYKDVIMRMYNGLLPNKGSVYQRTGIHGDRFELMEKLLNNPKAFIAYPTYKLPNSSVYFTHGHLFGGLYTFLSDILKPFLPENLPHADVTATVNVAVIEFIYWLIGETGHGMGAEGIMEAIYMDFQKGKKSLIYKALESAADVLLKDGVVKCFPDSWERTIAKWVARRIIDKTVKEPKPITSMDRLIPSETSRTRASEWVKNTIQEKPKLVVGHTHVSDHFVDESMELFNLGSWLVGPNEPEPDSNVLLIEDNNLELKKV